MEKLLCTFPSIALGLPSGTCWHMMPAQLPSSSSTSYFFGSYPEDDSMLPTYEQAQELIETCDFCLGKVESRPCYLLHGPEPSLPVVAPILSDEESELDMEAAKFWVKSTDPTSAYAPFMLFSREVITIGMTLKSSRCMVLLPGE